MPLKSQPFAVVFDMDGVLFDTERLYQAAMIEVVADHGYEMNTEFYCGMLGQPWQPMHDAMVAYYGGSFPINAVRDAWRSRFTRLCEEQLALKVGVLELLDQLDAMNIPFAIATSSRTVRVTEHLTRFDLFRRFNAIVAQEDYTFGKPDPAPYRLAAQRLALKPTDCLALEDSFNGVRSATSAGMVTIMVPDLLKPTREVADLCHAVVPDLRAVHSMLQGNHLRY